MIRRVASSWWGAPLALLIATLAAYGLFATQQGYAWDDWGVIWLAKFTGPQGLIDYFNHARPLWGYFYVTTTALLGTNPLSWQIFALIMRWLAALGFWWCLRLTWPTQPRFAFWAALFALLYPGFSQHSIAIAYGHYSLNLAIFFASLSLSIMALRAQYTQIKRGVLIVVALTLSALNIFSVEYFFGLELLRPLFFWFILGESIQENKPRLQKLFRHYLPYALVVLTFIIWRGFFYESTLYAASAVANPLGALQALPSQLVGAIWNAVFAAWVNSLHMPPAALMGARLTFIYWALSIGGAFALTFFARHMQASEDAPATTNNKSNQWLALGAMGLLTAGIPFYVARLNVSLQFPDDRFTQPFAFAVALLLAAALERMTHFSWRIFFAGLLIALAIGAQIQNAFYFREDWKLQKSYFWQFYWRVPALQNGTAILIERPPFAFTDDDAMAFPTNWILFPHLSGAPLVMQVSLATRLSFNSTTMQFATPISGQLFTSDFNISPDKLLMTQFAPPSCLRILDPIYDSHLPLAPLADLQAGALVEAGIPLLGRRAAAVLPASNVRVVQESSDASMPESIFGPEPAHTWCYYFEKADLARQFGDWAEVARLGDEAIAATFRPDDLSEYLPFIEAYARLGREKEARELTLKTANAMPLLAPALCAVWQRLALEAPATDAAKKYIRDTILKLSACPVLEGDP